MICIRNCMLISTLSNSAGSMQMHTKVDLIEKLSEREVVGTSVHIELE